ncbi:MAG: CRISPR-associated helicase Cas3' [Caldilineaceae bacterium]|nr:CRISPR-associated helicase Cas3' [Caldilineaceae bacterium]
MCAWTPYDYQLGVSQRLLSGKSVVLQAPTGAGKTAAALLPFIHAWREEVVTDFPKKCIYVVPMRVLAHQFVQEYRSIAASLSRRYRRDLTVSIQTGDQPDDPRFEADIIFCTIDQFLSSYLTMPYSLPRRLANLNAGAMVGAYVVFDEFHLLDPESSLPSALYAIKQLRQLAPVMMMTATFSSAMLQALADEVGAEPVLVSPEEARRIETRNGTFMGRQRRWGITSQPLLPRPILDMHRTRTLVLCNTVRHAQALYRALRDTICSEGREIDLLLLHSRFLPEDRRAIEAKLRQYFGKNSDTAGSMIAVATQTIEVGVDISCEILHTELAPASALIQRAGRCARYPGQQGQVIVYPVETFAPYGRARKNEQERESSWVTEMRAALAYLNENADQVFDFGKEQEFVDAVATPRDRQIVVGIAAGASLHREAIHRVLDGNIQGQDRRLLVRDADSLLVLVHPDPNRLLENPYAAIGFSIARPTLHGMVKEWLERESECEWRVKGLLEDISGEQAREEQNHTRYAWGYINHAALIDKTQVLVVNPMLAGYLPDAGFVPDQGETDFVSSLPGYTTTRAWETRVYRLEAYATHIRLVLQAFEDLARPEMESAACALERAARWQEGSVLQAARLVCLLHDTGKLSQGWQGWARRYQQAIGSPVAANYMMAHTEFDRHNPLHIEGEKAANRAGRRAPHAGESALAVSCILVKALNNEALSRAALTAIARHHTPYARECEAYSLETVAPQEIKCTLDLLDATKSRLVDLRLLRPSVTTKPAGFSAILSTPNDTYSWLAYLLLARALRRADQEGTRRGMLNSS